MLKKIRDNLDGLSDELKGLYTQKPDGKFHLQLEDDDAEPLRRAKEHEVTLRKLAEKDRDDAQAALATANAKVEELTKAQSKTSEELRADHEKAVAKLNEKHAAEKAGLEATIKKVFVTDVASRIAKDIAIDEGAAELLTDKIAARLSVEIVNGEPLTRVMNADGTASNATPDELQNEFFTSTKYAGIMRASGATGGGASGGSKGGGATGKKLDDLSSDERTKLARENPAEFQRLVNEKRESVNAR